MRDLDPSLEQPRFTETALEFSRQPGFSFPELSTRRWRDIAFTLSITAGVLAIAFSIWPIAFLHGYVKVAIVWGMIGHFAGGLYLAAAYLARRRRPAASPLLSIAGLLLIFSGLGSGRLLAISELEFWWLAVAFDLLPIMLGVLGAGAVETCASLNPPARGGEHRMARNADQTETA
jgi:hypothetical protein